MWFGVYSVVTLKLVNKWRYGRTKFNDARRQDKWEKLHCEDFHFMYRKKAISSKFLGTLYIYFFPCVFCYKSERSMPYSAVETVCYSGSFDKYFRRKISAQIQQQQRVNIASYLRCSETDIAASICNCGPAGRIWFPSALNRAHLQNFSIATTRSPNIPRRSSLCSYVIITKLLNS
jgi:hypothetical protein